MSVSLAEPLLGPKDAARLLHVSLRTVYALVASGELPALRVGGSLRFSRSQLENWLERKTAAP